MPVFGLPLSLEASLNSLVELRPPTSWRVSGHGNDITVVLRWTLSGSPSSDKTLDYDIDHIPRSSAGVTAPHVWPRGLKRPQNHSPAMEVKTRCSSIHDCRVSTNSQSQFEGFQPLKLRKVDRISQFSPNQSSPVPVYLTVSDVASPSPSRAGHTNNISLSCDNIQDTNHDSEIAVYNNQNRNDCDSRLKSLPETTVIPRTSQNPSPIADIEMRDVIRTYLTPCCSDISPDRETVMLDEKSGLFTNLSGLDEEVAEDNKNSLQISEPIMCDQIQNDSGCASESNSTSLSHYVKHTLSHDSSSQDGSHFKSPSCSTAGADQDSPADQRCSSAGSSVSRSSFALQSCSSKTKMESFDSSNDNTNEKDNDCHSSDLDMACLNEEQNDQVEARSASSRSSISYWDSFDSFQSELIAGEGEVSEEANRDVTNKSV